MCTDYCLYFKIRQSILFNLQRNLPFLPSCVSPKLLVLKTDLHVSSRSSVLLLAPLLAETDPAPRRIARPTGSAGAQGTDGLYAQFRWMAEHVPAFRVPGTHIHILTSPDQFYQAMKVSVTEKIQFRLQRNEGKTNVKSILTLR